jgi:hypothetical protein
LYVLEALRYYGEEGPIAIIRRDGESMAYTRVGIDSLLAKYRGDECYASLLKIKQQMSQSGDYKDIQESDFSGQKELFSEMKPKG